MPVSGSIVVDYAWDSTDFGGSGTVTFSYNATESADADATVEGDGGGIPGFTGLLTATALLGAVLYLGRRD